MQGLTSSYTLEHDVVFDAIRKQPDFRRELDRARRREEQARQAFDRAGGPTVLARGRGRNATE